MGRQDPLAAGLRERPADAGRSRLPLGTGRVSLYSGSLRQKSHELMLLPSATPVPVWLNRSISSSENWSAESLRLSGMTESPAIPERPAVNVAICDIGTSY